LRELAESLIESLCQSANLLGSIGAMMRSTLTQTDYRAGREPAIAEDGTETRGNGGVDKTRREVVAKERSAGFGDYVVAGKPELAICVGTMIPSR